MKRVFGLRWAAGGAPASLLHFLRPDRLAGGAACGLGLMRATLVAFPEAVAAAGDFIRSENEYTSLIWDDL